MPDSLVSHEWELLDPTPDPIALFIQYNKQFFWGKLESVVVSWSPRMTTCAGICCYEGRGGMCSIKLSTPLLKLRPRKDLVETLLHEMIHAYLFVTQNNRDRDGHGPEFQKHMHRINAVAKTNITIYHNFYDEVRHYKTHVWKCDGPCQHRRPYYGLVKRASNRAPGPNDLWWKDHQASCGGKYHKISEPEEFTKKQEAKKEKDEVKRKKEEAKRRSQITNYLPSLSSPKTSAVPKSGRKPQTFTGTHVLGSSSTAGETSTNGSNQPMVRRLPGFGEVPLRMPSATITLSNSDSISDQTSPSTTTQSQHSVKTTTGQPQSSFNTNTTATCSENNVKTTITHPQPSVKTTTTQPQYSVNATRVPNKSNSQTGQRSITDFVKSSTTTTSLSTCSKPTKALSVPLPTRAQSEVIDLCSDSDDDLMLYTSRPSQSKSSNMTKRKHSPNDTSSSHMNLSSELIDSDEELDLLIANLKEKRRRSSCVHPPPATSISSQSRSVSASKPATGSGVTQSSTGFTVQSSSNPGSTSLKAGMCRCPLCGQQVLLEFINEHMDMECTS